MDTWPRRREVARGVLRSSRKPEKKVFLPSESDRDFLSVFYTLLIAAIFCETPGRRPPHITGRRVNTVTLEWVGAPNERALFRFLDAVVGFVDRCLSRTQNLVASNERLAEFLSGGSWPKICPGSIVTGLKRRKFIPRPNSTPFF